jgi:hypothetical protein
MSPMNNRLLVPRKTPGLLDLVPGAAAAYSLRSLSNSYAGPVVTVRRSSDDAEEDFTASEVSDGTLAAFAGAGDAFVKQWWDQSGNANHAVAAADTNEPKIVDSGVVVLEEGKPALQFDGSDDYMTATPMAISQPAFFASVQRLSNGSPTTYQKPYDGTVSGNRMNISRDLNVSPPGYSMYAGSVIIASQEFQLLQEVWIALFFGSSSYLRVNGAAVISGNTGAQSITGLRIGGDDDLNTWWGGTIQEVIVYPSDLTSQRELIEGNIAWSYSV